MNSVWDEDKTLLVVGTRIDCLHRSSKCENMMNLKSDIIG